MMAMLRSCKGLRPDGAGMEGRSIGRCRGKHKRRHHITGVGSGEWYLPVRSGLTGRAVTNHSPRLFADLVPFQLNRDVMDPEVPQALLHGLEHALVVLRV